MSNIKAKGIACLRCSSCAWSDFLHYYALTLPRFSTGSVVNFSKRPRLARVVQKMKKVATMMRMKCRILVRKG